MFREVSSIDRLYEIDKYIIQPEKKDIFLDVKHGELVISLNGNYFGYKFEVIYGAWQVGEELRIGFLIKQDDVLNALIHDNQEFSDVFENNNAIMAVKYGGIYYEWKFIVPKLYKKFEFQELFIIKFRHMHITVLRTLYNHLKAIQSENKI